METSKKAEDSDYLIGLSKLPLRDGNFGRGPPSSGCPVPFETSSEGWKRAGPVAFAQRDQPFETSSEGWKLILPQDGAEVSALSKLPLRDGNPGERIVILQSPVLSKLPLRDGNLRRRAEEVMGYDLSKLPLRDGNISEAQTK